MYYCMYLCIKVLLFTTRFSSTFILMAETDLRIYQFNYMILFVSRFENLAKRLHLLIKLNNNIFSFVLTFFFFFGFNFSVYYIWVLKAKKKKKKIEPLYVRQMIYYNILFELFVCFYKILLVGADVKIHP